MVRDGEDHKVTCAAGCATLEGVFFLPSPSAFAELFSEISQDLEGPGDSYRIDVTKGEFMNSSGVAALARLVILAEKQQKQLTIAFDVSILWQRKLAAALENLSEALTIESVAAAVK